MFTAPPDQSLEWNDEGVEGAARFLKRLWNLASDRAEVIAGAAPSADPADVVRDARREVHLALKKALFDYERHQFNTVVSGCMTIVNVLAKIEPEQAGGAALLREGLGITLRLLAPIVPHVTHRLWQDLGFGGEILDGGWPAVDEAALVQDQIGYVVQVNGKVRGQISVPAQADKEAIEAAALANENVQRFIEGLSVRKVIVVPSKLVNVVAK
jgi:leucyl-tRNA synthetase